MILTQDDAFHAAVDALLRRGPVPISIAAEGPGSRKADLFIIDARNDAGVGDGAGRVAPRRIGDAPASSSSRASRTRT